MLAITGAKGGCGKTTVTVGIARGLAEQGHEPLVVDADCDMPDVHHRLGLSRGGVDALAQGTSLSNAVSRPPDCPKVAVLTGGRRDSLGTALLRAACWDGPVLVDCGAGITPGSVRPLRHANSALVVSTDEPQCIEDSEQTRTVADRLPATLEGVVLRETPGHGRAEPPSEWSVIERLPYIHQPLQSRQLQRKFVTLATAMYSNSERERTVQLT